MDVVAFNVTWVFAAMILFFGEIEARDYCGKRDGKEIVCDEGLCCGEFDCCHYSDKYYKMWWFWLVWGSISLLGCCCAYYRKRYFASHCQIRNFVYLTTHPSAAQPTNTYGPLENDLTYKLPSYAEVEEMGSLGPPAEGEDAPPPYVDTLANQELRDDIMIPQDDVSSRRTNEGVAICFVAQGN
ncbi:WW domain binding protein 1-like [Montipora foliosa]|uniref:WW domain binding protein 1-like n=1 Tax=Montipora foliosa TaxID=591990 RepID=UPI0035F1BB28